MSIKVKKKAWICIMFEYNHQNEWICAQYFLIQKVKDNNESISPFSLSIFSAPGNIQSSLCFIERFSFLLNMLSLKLMEGKEKCSSSSWMKVVVKVGVSK